MRMHKDEIIELLESLRIKEDITDSEKTLSNINKTGSEYSNSLNDPSIHENGIPFPIYDENNETIITRTIKGINNLTLNPFEIDWMQVTLYETNNIKELLKGIDSLFILQVAQAFEYEKSSFIRDNEYVGDVISYFYGTGQQNSSFYTFRREHSNYEDISAVSIAESILETRKKSEEYKILMQSRATNIFQQNTTEPQQVCEEDKAMKEKVEELTLELRKKQEVIDSLKQQLEDANTLISGLNQKIEDLNNLDDELNSNDKRRLDFGLTTGTWAAIANGLALFGTNYTKEKIAVALHDFTGRSAQRIRTETPSSKDIDKAKEFLQNIKNKI